MINKAQKDEIMKQLDALITMRRNDMQLYWVEIKDIERVLNNVLDDKSKEKD